MNNIVKTLPGSEKGQRNCSIDIFRIVCAVLVVAIHIAPFSDLNGGLSYFIKEVLTRIAVPFFFCTSGYYYIKALQAGKPVFKKTCLRLLTVYTVWSALYFLISLLRTLASHGSLLDWVLTCVKNYFIYGSEYQLWFFPALFFCLFVVTLFHKIKQVKLLAYLSLGLFVIGCLACSYYALGNQLPLLRDLINLPQFTVIRRIVLMGLPFYMLGYFLNRLQGKITGKKLSVGLGLSIIVFFAEIGMVIALRLQKNTIITFGLYGLLLFVMLFLLAHPMRGKEKTARYTRGIANFMFYSHPLFIMLLSDLTGWLCPGVFFSPTLLFFIIIAITSILGFCIVKLDNKVLNKMMC